MGKYKSKFNGQQIDDGIEFGVRVTQQTFSSAQKQQARGNINAQETITDNAQIGCGIGTCSTAAATAAKVVTLSGYELKLNGFVAVTFDNDVPANATLNINNKGAKPIIYKGAAIVAGTIKADDTITFCYDGTNYVVTSGLFQTGDLIFINLSTEDNDDSDLIGASVKIYDTNNVSIVYLDTTWQGVTIQFTIPTNVAYTVEVSSTISEHAIETNTQSYVAIATSFYQRNINFVYENSLCVDLGLPSGTLWARFNLGAVNIYDYGLYFSWGNITGYNLNAQELEYNFEPADYGLTEGHNLSGNIPNDTRYDAAYLYKNYYRLPTYNEFIELYENTDMEVITDIQGSSIIGWKFMKKSNHNIYMILPCNGRSDDSNFVYLNGNGHYWTSDIDNADNAYSFSFNSTPVRLTDIRPRYYGMGIRPVIK